jgi:hypothetical protein
MNEPRRPAENPPAEAFAFQAVPLTVTAGDDGAQRRLEGVAYSGEVISPHSYWGAVIFDLASLELPERVPVLVDHDRAQRAGWASLAIRNGALEIAEGRLLQNAHGQAVADDADQGFPWQMSVHIEPARVEEITTGAAVVVNGRTVHGPAFVFRQSRIREVTVTPTGADHRTRAQVFSAPALPPEPTMSNPNGNAPTVETLQAELAALREQFNAQGAQLTAANARVATFESEQRASQVRELFSATGMAHSDAAAAPFLTMSAEQFSATAASLRGAIKPAPTPAPTLPGSLFSEVATTGGAVDATDANALAAAAVQFQAEREQAGQPVTMAQAVAAVRARSATAAQ